MRFLFLFFVFIFSVSSNSVERKILAESSVEITQIKIEAGVQVEASYFAQDGEDFSFSADWSFLLDNDYPDKAKIEVIFDLGNHYVVSKSNRIIGITRQEFYDFQYLVDGVGSWDMDQRILFFQIEPTGLDNGIASRTSFSKKPSCKKVSGLFADRACQIFLTSSLALEGIKLKIKFSDTFSHFEGEGTLIQHGGIGLNESFTTIDIYFTGKASIQK